MQECLVFCIFVFRFVVTMNTLNKQQMKNFDILTRFEQMSSVRIETLIWVAGAISSSDSKVADFLLEIPERELKKMFPEIGESEEFGNYIENNDFDQALVDYKKFGFLAEVHFPKCSGFKFDGDRPFAWRVNEGYCTVMYFYAETTENLVEQIEKYHKIHFEESVARERKAKNP